ncbi:MAG TPA: tRNA pseudouridine(13) synthase TruD, partial [Pseudomonas sp.]|nr:tRNA pseudouridine(13) synthase TruD [Pseudomonas sp.]
LHPTGPLWGAGDAPTTGPCQALEQRVAATEPAIAKWLADAGMKHERRVLRLPIGNLSWHYPEPDILQLEFVLPTGCFATAVVRELVSLAGQTDI